MRPLVLAETFFIFFFFSFLREPKLYIRRQNPSASFSITYILEPLVPLDHHSTMSYPRYTKIPKAHQIDSLRKDRLAGFISRDQWKGINLLSVLYKKRYSDLKIEVHSAPNLDRPSFQAATANDFKPTDRKSVV